MDSIIESFNIHKYFHIITTKPEQIEAYITGTLKRGATELHGEGAYTHEGRTVLLLEPQPDFPIYPDEDGLKMVRSRQYEDDSPLDRLLGR